MRVLHLVIVALIILVVGSVLVAGVVKVREAANKMQCVNHLKQIGLAIHNYHDTYRHFPAAGKAKPALSVEHRLSWSFMIVPFLESGPKLGDAEEAWDSDENRTIPLSISYYCYNCPSFPGNAPTSKFLPMHYLGISGIGTDAAALPFDDPNAGFFGYDRKLSMKDIKNGLSSMLAVVETAWPTGAWTAATDSVRGLDPAGSPYLGVPGHFGGNHPGGANVLFADGSVRFLESSMNPQKFEAMARIAGESTVADPP